MADTLGTIKGQMVLDVKQALASYTRARQQHVATVTALRTGGAALEGVGKGFIAAGGAIAGAFVYATAKAAEFERKLDYFAAISGTTGKEFDAVKNKALELGKDTIYSADQVAGAFVELGKAGVSAKDIVGGVGKSVTSLAAAADIPLDTAANIMLAAVQTFGLSANDAVTVADKLSGAANASMVDVQDLGVSFKYTGGVAHAMGLSFDDVNTALGLLGKYGIKGSTAGTSLRQTLVSLPGASKAATAELKELGIITADGSNKFFDAQGKIKPLPKIFDILQKSTKGLTQEQKVQAFKTIFQSRALSTVLALTKEGSKGFDTMAKSIDKTKAADVATKRLDNLSGDIEILRGNLDTLAIQVGTLIQPMARTLIQGITGIINAFMNLPDGVKQTILIVLAVVAALLILGGILLVIAGSVLGFIATILVIAPVIAGIIEVVSAIIGGIAAFGGALLAFLGPVGIVIAIIAVIVAALVWFFTQTEVGKTAWANFCKFLAEAWTNIVNVATSVWSGIVSFFSGLWAGIVAGVKGFIAGVVSFFLNFTPQGLIISHWGDIVGFFAGVWNAIVTGVTSFISFVISAFVNFPANVAKIWNMLPTLIGYALGLLLGTIVRIILSIGVFLFTTVPAFIVGVIGFFMALPGQIGAFIAQLYITVITFFVLLAVTVLANVASFISGVVGFFQSLPARVLAFILLLVFTAIAQFIALRARVLAIASAVISGVIGFFAALPGRAAALFAAAVAAVRGAFTKAVEVAKTVAKNVVDGVKTAIAQIPGIVTGIFNKAVDAIKGVITGAFNAAKDFAGGLWKGFQDGLGIHSPSYIEHAMWAITDVTGTETDRLGKQVRTIQGLGNNINDVGASLGQGWGTGVSLDDLYKQVAAAKELDNSFGSGGGVTLASGPGAPKSQADAAAGGPAPVVNNYNTTVNNPEPEPASDSLPRSIRATAYMVG